MNRLLLVSSALLLALNVSVADAGAHKTKKSTVDSESVREKVESVDERAGGKEAVEEYSRKSREMQNKTADTDDDDDVITESEDRGIGGDAEDDQEYDYSGENANKANRGKSEGKGSERAQEMRAQRDERKAIKEEYKGERDADPEFSGAGSREKKPWWKFWESE